MLIIVIGNRFQRTLPTGLHKPSGGSHYRQRELIVRVRWHTRVIFQGRYVEVASHHIASRWLGSTTISRRHIDDLCMSVRIPEDHCSSLALCRFAFCRAVSRTLCSSAFSPLVLVRTMFAPGAAGHGHKGDLLAISEGSHCAIDDRDRNPARASALATMGNDWETVCVICIPARKHGPRLHARNFSRRAVSRRIQDSYVTKEKHGYISQLHPFSCVIV